MIEYAGAIHSIILATSILTSIDKNDVDNNEKL
jgi:hypothetical protein